MDQGEGIKGVPIVLTASRAEANEYENNPFAAFICTFPKKFSSYALRDHLQKLPSKPDGTAKRTVYGLRKVESLLIDTFGEDMVKTVHYDQLHKFIGSETKIVGISSMDPMGLAYVSTTYNSLIGLGGESLNATEFKRLLAHPSILRYKPKIVVGGQGAWQIKEAKEQENLGIDVLFQGEGEQDIIVLFKKLLKGKATDPIQLSKRTKRERVPLIKHAASYGMVEIMRGCGRGCHFCSPTMRNRYSFPLDHIMKEVDINIREGARSIFTVTEDIFLYKCHDHFIPNRQAVVSLFKTIASYPGVEHILLSHASFAPIIYDEKLLEELTPILIEKTKWNPQTNSMYKHPFISVEMGIESGSVCLMNKHMKGKALPFSVDNWPELVVQAIGTMNDNDWWPLCTIMAGQPDETEEDIIATLDLIDNLRAINAKMFYTPVLFIPLEDAVLGHCQRTNLDSLSELHWEVLARCWQNNIEFWVPEKRWMINTGFLFSYWLYYRWKHGRKSMYPVMRLAGFPSAKIGKTCEPELCYEHNGNHFLKETYERIREWFH